MASLPTTAAELGSIVPVPKTLFIDLLDPTYKVNATRTIRDVIAEKIEALAWGPDLPDGAGGHLCRSRLRTPGRRAAKPERGRSDSSR